ncbi:hypothetical protein ABT084_13665 [Streptomyces sp. NPDC002138]|uniref:hypothetical protein n=1 Tax=Streptomyces sp. NPDC002138 TaxID=3154410 RepID=UPI003322E1AB
MTYEITGTGHRMHDRLTRQEAEQLGRTAEAVWHGPNLHTEDGTWYVITAETAQ